MTICQAGQWVALEAPQQIGAAEPLIYMMDAVSPFAKDIVVVCGQEAALALAEADRGARAAGYRSYGRIVAPGAARNVPVDAWDHHGRSERRKGEPPADFARFYFPV